MSAEIARTLIVFAHPALERARVNPAMAEAARSLPGVMLHDIYELYPDFAIDVRHEQKLLTRQDLIVLQFPLYWYSAPALLKEWLDLVLQHGFAYGRGGTALKGKSLFCAVSTGGSEHAYGRDGPHRYTVEEFLRPLEQTASVCHMRWEKPFVIHSGASLSPADLTRQIGRYRERLQAAMTQAISLKNEG